MLQCRFNKKHMFCRLNVTETWMDTFRAIEGLVSVDV